MQFWNELEGKVTEEGYRLGHLVRSEGRTAWFDTNTTGVAPRSATISLTESLTDADEIVARLEAAQRLEHANLLAILRIGRTRLDQTPFVYALMEHADQNLAEILRGQPLSKEDGRQVAEAMTSALTAIHQQGWVHGRVEPASILAVGDSVKLRSDCLQMQGGARSQDVAGIGETLFQVFLQRKPSSADDPQINRIPAPFAEIVRNSLSSRWGLPQIAAVLKPSVPSEARPAAPAMPRPQPPAPPITTPPAPKAASTAEIRSGAPDPPASEEEDVAETMIEEPVLVERLPGRANPEEPSLTGPSHSLPAERGHNPIRESRDRHEDNQEQTERRPFWRSAGIYVVIAIVLAIILGFVFLRHTGPPPATPAPAGVLGSSASGRVQSPSTAQPRSSAPQNALGNRAASAAAGAQTRDVWRVVAYTYHHQQQAQQKADEINKAHPGLHASAYSPQGDARHILVVLGGAMDRQQAFALRQRAVRDGLAADSYVQDFSR